MLVPLLFLWPYYRVAERSRTATGTLVLVARSFAARSHTHSAHLDYRQHVSYAVHHALAGHGPRPASHDGCHDADDLRLHALVLPSGLGLHWEPATSSCWRCRSASIARIGAVRCTISPPVARRRRPAFRPADKKAGMGDDPRCRVPHPSRVLCAMGGIPRTLPFNRISFADEPPRSAILFSCHW